MRHQSLRTSLLDQKISDLVSSIIFFHKALTKECIESRAGFTENDLKVHSIVKNTYHKK